MTTCKKHNVNYEPPKRCNKCNVIKVQKRRERVKQLAVEYKGNQCSICGYDRCIAALEFHHTDPATKEFGISESGWTRSWERMMVELDKCILVCANCHRELEHCIPSWPIG